MVVSSGIVLIDSFFRTTCSIYEIYPQSETPRLTQIAYLDNFDPSMKAYLLPGTVIWLYPVMDRLFFKVWDYQLNHSITFSIVDNFDFQPEVYIYIFKWPRLASNSFVGR